MSCPRAIHFVKCLYSFRVRKSVPKSLKIKGLLFSKVFLPCSNRAISVPPKYLYTNKSSKSDGGGAINDNV